MYLISSFRYKPTLNIATKYILSRTVAFFQYLPFILLHYTLTIHTSSLQFTSLYVTSLAFTTVLAISTKPSLHLIYHFPDPLPKTILLTGESP
jgi:hypothetical protein